MKNAEIVDNFAFMLRSAREYSGKSQEYVAKKMGVAKKTIQNWESGYSSPTLTMCMSLFDAMGVPPMPFFLTLLYEEFEDLAQMPSEDKVEKALIERIKVCSPAEKRKLLFILYGDHGSSSHAILEMICAHLHLPLKYRLSTAQQVILNYEIAENHNSLIKTEHVMPDMAFLKNAFEAAKASVINNKESYSSTKKE